jgi:hypothetical protein
VKGAWTSGSGCPSNDTLWGVCELSLDAALGLDPGASPDEKDYSYNEGVNKGIGAAVAADACHARHGKWIAGQAGKPSGKAASPTAPAAPAPKPAKPPAKPRT